MDDRSRKFVFIAVTAAITCLICVGTFLGGLLINTRSRASASLSSETNETVERNKSLSAEKDALTKQQDELSKQISEKSSINKTLDESSKKLAQLKQDLKYAQDKSSEFDSSISSAKEKLALYADTKKNASGKEKTLTKGTYTCPKDIEAGRCTIHGTGTLLVYDASNSLIINENLSELDTKSYTFNLVSGGKIVIM